MACEVELYLQRQRLLCAGRCRGCVPGLGPARLAVEGLVAGPAVHDAAALVLNGQDPHGEGAGQQAAALGNKHHLRAGGVRGARVKTGCAMNASGGKFTASSGNRKLLED